MPSAPNFLSSLYEFFNEMLREGKEGDLIHRYALGLEMLGII
jgi:hypothetical protein